jgi:hypothetical protein
MNFGQFCLPPFVHANIIMMIEKQIGDLYIQLIFVVFAITANIEFTKFFAYPS